MKKVKGFVTNFTFVKTFDEFMHYVKNDYMFDIETILEAEPDEIIDWTSPYWARRGQYVFFMFAKSSPSNFAKVLNEWKSNKEQGNYSEEEIEKIEMYLSYCKELIDDYSGKIIAVGKVSDKIVYDSKARQEHRHWVSNIYAPITEITQLEHPISIDEFRNFLFISRRGAITEVDNECYEKLKALILKYNDYL